MLKFLNRLFFRYYQPSVGELLDYRCKCGKKVKDHDFGVLGQTARHDQMKVIYDIGKCTIPEGYFVKAYPNGFGKFSYYELVKQPKGYLYREWLEKNMWI